MEARKRIALVAHDARKAEMIAWVRTHQHILVGHDLWATGTTGALLEAACHDLRLAKLMSGPLGGDQQIGAMICEGRLDALFFFVDPLAAQAHADDVKALVRLAGVHDVLLACTRAAADFIITNPAFGRPYINHPLDPTPYTARPIPGVR